MSFILHFRVRIVSRHLKCFWSAYEVAVTVPAPLSLKDSYTKKKLQISTQVIMPFNDAVSMCASNTLPHQTSEFLSLL